MKRLVLLAAVWLAGCGTVEKLAPVFTVKEVKIPVAVACDPEIGPDPVYADSDTALTDPLKDYVGAIPSDVSERAKLEHYLRVQNLVVGRLQRIQRDKVLNAALNGCRTKGGEDGVKVHP